MQVNLSEFYTLQEEKRFRFIHRARQTFQFYTPCKTNFSDCYKVQDKFFRFMNAASHTFRFIHHASQSFRIIHPVGGTLQIYTSCKTNFSDIYTLQDKLFRLLQATRQAFQIYARCKSNFQIDAPFKTIFQVSMPCRTNVADLYSEQDKRFRLMHPAG